MSTQLSTVSGYLDAVKESLDHALTTFRDAAAKLEPPEMYQRPQILLAGGRQGIPASSILNPPQERRDLYGGTITLRMERAEESDATGGTKVMFGAYISAPPADANLLDLNGEPTSAIPPEDLAAMLFSWIKRRPFLVEDGDYTDRRLHAIDGPVMVEADDYDPKVGTSMYLITWTIPMPADDRLGQQVEKAQVWAQAQVEYYANSPVTGVYVDDPPLVFSGRNLAAAINARDAHFAADPAGVARYQGDPGLAIILTPTSEIHYAQTCAPGKQGAPYDAAQWLDHKEAPAGWLQIIPPLRFANTGAGEDAKTAETNRDAYFRIPDNADVLKRYQGDRDLAISLVDTTAGTVHIQTYDPKKVGEVGDPYDATLWENRE